MKLRSLFFACALVFLAASAQAQVGVYFNPIVTRVSISTPDSGVYAFLGQGNTSQTFGGVSVGAYYEFMHDPKFTVAADLRDELEHGNNALLNSFLVGARVVGRPTERLRPYFQVSGGEGTTHSPLNPKKLNRATFKAYAGADYSINRHIDFRAIEIGYGSLTTQSSANFDATSHIPAANLISFSSGFVFRFGGGASATRH